MISRVVLLDGLWGAPWRMSWMAANLRREGFSEVVTFGYDSSGRHPIEKLADQLASSLRQSPLRPQFVAAHSMGGLILRAALAMHPDLPVDAVAFLCVPHAGSNWANALPMPGIRQMRPDSDFLRWLDSTPWQIPSIAVWCPGDLMVIPASNSRWRRAQREITCHVPLHNWPVLSRPIHLEIARFWREASASRLIP